MAGLLVIAGEASADLHASHVLRELRARQPDLRVAGIGGDLCRAEGMEILVDNKDLAIMGFTEVLGALKRVNAAMDACLKWVADHQVNTALLLDYAGFNLKLARKLKERGVRVVYFISPKLWAWGEGRVAKVRRFVDRMLVIFPFEVDFYRRHDVAAEYVGNPSLDELREPPRREGARASLHLAADTPVVALLPGSRRSEVTRHMDPLLAAAEQIGSSRPGTRFLIPRAHSIPLEWLAPHVERARQHGVDVEIVDGRAPEVVAAADAAVVASGTATLEAALVGTPMVVIYRTAWLNALIIKVVLQLAWVSLVNILAGRELVKELLQQDATPELIAHEVLRILSPAGNRAMREQLVELRRTLGEPGAPGRVADVVLQELARPGA